MAGGAIPVPDDAVRRDIAAYWAVHDRVNPGIRKDVLTALRAAVVDGAWGPCLERLWEQGRAYAARVALGVELGGLRTIGDLQRGIDEADGILGPRGGAGDLAATD